MPEIYWYFLKVVLISGILYGYYHIALRDRIFHHWNRYYLLSSVAVSLLLPLIRIPLSSGNDGIITVLNSVTLQDAVIINSTAPTSGIVGMENFVLLAYIIISLTILTGFIRTFFRLQKIKQKFPAIRMQNILFYNTDAAGTPFSFFYSLFWNRAIELDSDNGQQIFHHELTHIREKHSLDKVFMQIILLFAWINPFFWLIRKELDLVHEYIADSQAISDQDIASFSRMLLSVAHSNSRFSITNYFFHSPIKRRLTMLTKNNNKKLTYFTRLLVLPLVAFLVVSFTLKVAQHERNSSNNPNQLTAAILTDTLPSEIQSTRVITPKGDPYLIVKYKNGKEEKLTFDEARKRGISIPPPPPPPPPPPVESVKVITENGKPYAIVKYKNRKAMKLTLDEAWNRGIDIPGAVPPPPPPPPAPPVEEDGSVLTKVEKEASFPGGQNAWAKYIRQKILKDLSEFTNRDYGTVMVKFIVFKDGSVSDVMATTMQGTKLAEVAVNAIRKGPKWIPAQQNGKYVNAYRVQPVTLQNPGDTTATSPDKNNENNERVFTRADKPASFPGGQEAWSKYIRQKILIHLAELTDKDYGTVMVRFIVAKDGSVSNVDATTMKGTKLAEVAVEAISKGPKWIPAQQNGGYVNAYTVQPVTLQNPGKSSLPPALQKMRYGDTTSLNFRERKRNRSAATAYSNGTDRMFTSEEMKKPGISGSNQEATPERIPGIQFLKQNENALFFLNGKEISKEKLSTHNAIPATSISILRGDEVVLEYGMKAKDGVVLISTVK